eukprot:CAMPEP_0175736978 /NCGR_PEP_ID=MMETSP0097-20121207/53706_1 /TAXON_ID=311494 /ORGANISM="Alexandrium monilatum, Strain CCMP3105" /LENGTH=284 /DNA_ID=CAMNT_0017045105 /DNA_START=26 /DNA_END=877 /DNA_ORIENTATION=-
MLRMSAAARGLCTNPARGGRDQEVQHARGRVAAALRGPLPGHAAPAEVGPPTAANGRPQAPWRQLGSRSPRKSLATPGRKLSRWKMCWAPRSLLEPAVLRAVASPQTADPDTRDVSAKWTASLPGKRASAAAMSKLPTTLGALPGGIEGGLREPFRSEGVGDAGQLDAVLDESRIFLEGPQLQLPRCQELLRHRVAQPTLALPRPEQAPSKGDAVADEVGGRLDLALPQVDVGGRRRDAAGVGGRGCVQTRLQGRSGLAVVDAGARLLGANRLEHCDAHGRVAA